MLTEHLAFMQQVVFLSSYIVHLFVSPPLWKSNSNQEQQGSLYRIEKLMTGQTTCPHIFTYIFINHKTYKIYKISPYPCPYDTSLPDQWVTMHKAHDTSIQHSYSFSFIYLFFEEKSWGYNVVQYYIINI